MIEHYLEEQLQRLGLHREEYSEILIRLLDYGVICRDESQIEAALYDRYLHCAELVEDYLRIIGVRVQHNRQFSFIRIYPPGAEVPGLIDEENSPFNSGFRSRPSQHEVAVILVLRAEYEKSLREGQVSENGCVMLSLEALAIAMNNLLKRHLPEGQVERKNLFRRLRQLRLIQFNIDEELDSEESWLSIQPSITCFVNDEVLATLRSDNIVTEPPTEKPGQAPASTLFDDSREEKPTPTTKQDNE